MRHGSACGSTILAGLGAGLAVGHLVLLALCTACVADVRAQCADGLGMFTAAGHCGRSKLAGGGAIDVKGDAPRQHLDVVFFQARGRAMIAGSGAAVAGLDACGIALM